MELLFRTIHGSHLYNLARAGSDQDYFEVYANRAGRQRSRYAKQTIAGEIDLLKTDFSTFVLYAEKGVPQYLEAMYSGMADFDVIDDWRRSFNPNLYQVEKTYIRTIRNFYEEGSIKRRRHAHRLAINLRELKERGRFEPTLTDKQVKMVNYLAISGSRPQEIRHLTSPSLPARIGPYLRKD